MMKINLLRRTLAESARRRQQYRVELGIAVGVLVLLVSTGGWYWSELAASHHHHQILKEQKSRQLAEQERIRLQVKEVERQLIALQERSQNVRQLADQQRRSIQLLDVVSRSLDPLNLWLVNLHMEQDIVVVMGFAESKAHIVKFADDLKHDRLFQDVAIVKAEQSSEHKTVFGFSMNLRFAKESNGVTVS